MLSEIEAMEQKLKVSEDIKNREIEKQKKTNIELEDAKETQKAELEEKILILEKKRNELEANHTEMKLWLEKKDSFEEEMKKLKDDLVLEKQNFKQITQEKDREK